MTTTPDAVPATALDGNSSISDTNNNLPSNPPPADGDATGVDDPLFDGVATDALIDGFQQPSALGDGTKIPTPQARRIRELRTKFKEITNTLTAHLPPMLIKFLVDLVDFREAASTHALLEQIIRANDRYTKSNAKWKAAIESKDNEKMFTVAISELNERMSAFNSVIMIAMAVLHQWEEIRTQGMELVLQEARRFAEKQPEEEKPPVPEASEASANPEPVAEEVPSQ